MVVSFKVPEVSNKNFKEEAKTCPRGLLYHGFGIRGYQYLRTEYVGGKVVFTIGQEFRKLRCSVCKSGKVIRRGQIHQRFKTLSIGGKPVIVVLAIQRVFCCRCRALRQVKVYFADYRRSYTRAFERYVLELLQHMTIQDVARHLGISWDVIKDIQKRHLKRRFSRIPLVLDCH